MKYNLSIHFPGNYGDHYEKDSIALDVVETETIKGLCKILEQYTKDAHIELRVCMAVGTAKQD